MLRKFLVPAALAMAFCASASFAADKDPGKFEDLKKNALAKIDERIAKLQEHKACVSAAADGEALKACHAKMKDQRMDMKERHLEKKKERMEKRMQKMKERKSKGNS